MLLAARAVPQVVFAENFGFGKLFQALIQSRDAQNPASIVVFAHRRRRLKKRTRAQIALLILRIVSDSASKSSSSSIAVGTMESIFARADHDAVLPVDVILPVDGQEWFVREINELIDAVISIYLGLNDESLLIDGSNQERRLHFLGTLKDAVNDSRWSFRRSVGCGSGAIRVQGRAILGRGRSDRRSGGGGGGGDEARAVAVFRYRRNGVVFLFSAAANVVVRGSIEIVLFQAADGRLGRERRFRRRGGLASFVGFTTALSRRRIVGFFGCARNFIAALTSPRIVIHPRVCVDRVIAAAAAAAAVVVRRRFERVDAEGGEAL